MKTTLFTEDGPDVALPAVTDKELREYIASLPPADDPDEDDGSLHFQNVYGLGWENGGRR